MVDFTPATSAPRIMAKHHWARCWVALNFDNQTVFLIAWLSLFLHQAAAFVEQFLLPSVPSNKSIPATPPNLTIVLIHHLRNSSHEHYKVTKVEMNWQHQSIP